jgi:hypothetical protein
MIERQKKCFACRGKGHTVTLAKLGRMAKEEQRHGEPLGRAAHRLAESLAKDKSKNQCRLCRGRKILAYPGK